MKKHNTNKSDLFADQHHKQTIDKLGDPFTEIEGCIDFAPLVAKVDRIASHSVSPQSGVAVFH